MLGLAAELSMANDYSDNKPKRKAKNTSKIIDSCGNIYNALSGSGYANWNIMEIEKELEVTDLGEMNINNKIAWMFPEYEKALEVVDYRKSEDIFPYWIIIENEPELEIINLVFK